MKKVLFVDDDPRVLDGLKRMLRPMRHEWEMEFAASGREALEILGQQPFNVVVTDMRMPGMDGAELLTDVKLRYPQVVRIVLSGYSDNEMVLRSVGQAHQYLSKPCDAETLKTTINRACSLRDLLEDKELIQVVSSIESLPSLPALYAEIMEELASPEGSLTRVGEIISKDVGMSAKILQLVNSAFFGMPRHVANPARAVSLIGLETVKALVLSVKIFSQFEESGLPGHFIAELWEHSMLTATIARDIARAEKFGQEKSDDAFMAGLLHDVGKLILLDKLPKKWNEIVCLADAEKIPVWESERRVIGTTHAEVGAYLLGIWGLSKTIVEAVGYHHSPNKCTDPHQPVLTSVHLANAFACEISSEQPEQPDCRMDLEFLAKQGIADRIDELRNVCEYADQPEEAHAS